MVQPLKRETLSILRSFVFTTGAIIATIIGMIGISVLVILIAGVLFNDTQISQQQSSSIALAEQSIVLTANSVTNQELFDAEA
jgi:hypothetical protein